MPEEIRRAIDLYLEQAYGPAPPVALQNLRPPDDFVPAAWLMNLPVERTPAGAPLDQVRSFALRLGNRRYPHMKLRLTRPPNDPVFLFSVDAHDEMLHAPGGAPDTPPLAELKRNNAAVAQAIRETWEKAGLLTEHTYLREKIKQLKTAQI